MTLSVFWTELGPRTNDSPLVTYRQKGGASMTRRFRTRWADAQLACQQLVGYSFAATVGGKKRLRRELPMGYVFDRTMVCEDAAIEAGEVWTGRSAYNFETGNILPGYPNNNLTKDSDGNPTDALHKVNEYKWARIRASFKAVDYVVGSDSYIDTYYGGIEWGRFVSYKDDREAKGVTVPGGKLYYLDEAATTSDGARRLVPFQVGKIEVHSTVTLTWHNVAIECIPFQTIDGLLGKINKTDFLIYPKGTLLFMAPQIDRYVMANGSIGADVKFILHQFKEGHLKVLIAKDGTLKYRTLTTDSNITAEPDVATLTADKFLFNAGEFADAFDPNNP